MVRSSRLFNVALLLLFAAFCFGLFRLVHLRYGTGDIFPTYSSHRADPLGTKVLYESMRMLPHHEVTRNERPLERIGSGADATLFLIGMNDPWLSDAAREGIGRFVQSGGRLVLAFYPGFESKWAEEKKVTGTPSPVGSASPTPSPRSIAEPEPTPKGISFTSLLRLWELKMKFGRNNGEDIMAARQAEELLEEQISWHSGITFDAANPAWRTIYSAKGSPVVVERVYGDGSVAVAADSYFLSNEAQLEERHPALLAWLAGPRRNIIFDETHLGVQENPSIATLLRRYGLGGFVIGSLVLIVLWLWRNAAHALKPRSSAALDDEIVSGRDSFAGFVHLLRRGITPTQLAGVCVAEWKKTAPSSRAAASADAVEVAARDAKNPVTAYNKINALLSAKKWKTKSAN